MSSVFQRAFKEKRQNVSDNAAYFEPALNQFSDLLQRDYENDLAVLKGMTTIEDKVAYKRNTLVPKYLSSLENWLADPKRKIDSYLPMVIIWIFDIGAIDQFLYYCDMAIKFGVDTPNKISRDWQTFATESVSEWADKESKSGRSPEPYLSKILAKLDSGEWKIFEKVAAKAYKVAGKNLITDENGEVNASYIGDINALEKSLELLNKALSLNDKCGVTDLVNTRIPARIRALKELADQ